MSYQLKVIKDYPVAFWPLDELSGTTASDRSGCGNSGTYVGSPVSNILPLVAGGQTGTKITNTAYITLPITKDYYSRTVATGFATSNNSDNDFCLEVWFCPTIASSSVTRIFGDTANKIGIFWDNGDIVFKVSDDNEVRHRVEYSKKSHHVFGVYNQNIISLYVDGVEVSNKSISNFNFTNDLLNLQIGPTSSAGDSFIVDAPAIYRYTLSDSSINRHYVAGYVAYPPIQVVYPDEGTLFTLTDANQKPSFDYSYPVNKTWVELLDDNTFYDITDKYIGFLETDTAESKTFVYEDFVAIPTQLDLVTSKIEWRNDIGIVVETSVDGSSYTPCVNGDPIPQYKKGGFSNSGNLYIKITMTSSDTSKYHPRLSFFCVSFYRDKDVYAENAGNRIVSDSEYSLGSLNYPVLSRNNTNGLRPIVNTGFKVNTKESVKTVEFFYTPPALTDSGLVSSIAGTGYSACNYSWRTAGTVSKTNIDKIYVNNVDKTSQTNISNVFTAGELHHVVIVFTSAISDDITFNYSSFGAVPALYKNLALYEKTFTAGDVETHHELYTGKPVSSVTEPSITVTENDIIVYNNDWVVLQSV